MGMHSKKRIIGEVAFAILSVLVVAGNGCAGARIIQILIKGYLKKKQTEKKRIPPNNYISIVLQRLYKQGLVERERRGIWHITDKGKKYISTHETEEHKKKVYQEFRQRMAGKRDTIIIFDIAETKRKMRDYLRLELYALGYHPLQKSVWIGGSPLPKEFIEYITTTHLLNDTHIFTIQKKGTI